MRPGRIVALVVGLVGLHVAGPVHAQLPFFSGEQVAPDVRFAGGDPLEDQLSTFEAGLDRQIDAARAEVAALEAELAEAPASARVGLPTSLLSLARERVRLLSTARSLVRRALEVAGTPPRAPQSVTLVELVDLETETRRLRESLAAQERAAARVEELASSPGRRADRPIEVARGRVEAARARTARAEALEIRVRARRAAQIAELAYDSLVRSGAARRAAVAKASEARREHEQRVVRVAVVPPDPILPAGTSSIAAIRFRAEARALADLRSDAEARVIQASEARAIAEEAMAWGHAALASGKGGPPAAMGPEPAQARLARIEGRLATAEVKLAQLRADRRVSPADAPWAGLLAAQQEQLDEIIGYLIEERQLTERTLLIADVVQTILRRDETTRPLWQTIALSLIVLLLGMMLLTRGPAQLRRVLGPTIDRIGLAERPRARVEAVSMLVWPVVVITGTASIIIWPILGLQVTAIEALEAVNSPLFYVEESPVSPLSVGQFVVTFWAAILLSRWLRRFLSGRLYPQTDWDIGLTNAFNTMVHYIVLVVGLIMGLRFVGVGFSSLAILAGVLGIGIGFGLRNITENFISGLIILAERPIKIGDFIEVKDGEVDGRVESIQARSTTVITRDNISMIIPNSEFVARPVVNWSHGDPKVRVPVPVGVAYGSDTDLVRKVLLEVAGRHGQVLKKPAPDVQFREFGSSSLDFLLLVWIDEQYHRHRIASDLHFAIDKAFRKRRIEIAFPQTDLHIRSIDPQVIRTLTQPPPEPEPPSEVLNIPDKKSIRPGAAARAASAGETPDDPSGSSTRRGTH